MSDQYITKEYKELNRELYRTSEKFGNAVGDRWLPQIKELSDKVGGVITILDYGCGRGNLVRTLNQEGFEAMGYDPAVEEWNNTPMDPVDMVVCCDVLEHVEYEFIEVTLDRLKRLATKAFFAVIALRPSDKTLADGRNAHISLLSSEKWLSLLNSKFIGGRRLNRNTKSKIHYGWTR